MHQINHFHIHPKFSFSFPTHRVSIWELNQKCIIHSALLKIPSMIIQRPLKGQSTLRVHWRGSFPLWWGDRTHNVKAQMPMCKSLAPETTYGRKRRGQLPWAFSRAVENQQWKENVHPSFLRSKSNSPREIKAEESKTQEKKNEKEEKRTEQKKPHPHAESRRGRGTLKARQHQNSLLTLRASAESLKNEWHVAWQSYLQHAMSHVDKAG